MIQAELVLVEIRRGLVNYLDAMNLSGRGLWGGSLLSPEVEGCHRISCARHIY